jgi:hypothetical protein
MVQGIVENNSSFTFKLPETGSEVWYGSRLELGKVQDS